MTGIEAAGLGKRYGSRWALRDCNLRIPRGRIVALVGPNGSGKTTLLHLAAGLIRPTEGAISIDGATPGHDPGLVGKVGLVAQDVPLYRGFTVKATLELGRRLAGGTTPSLEPVSASSASRKGSASASSPGGSEPRSLLRSPLGSVPRCCSSTSRSPTLIRSRAGHSCRPCWTAPPTRVSPSCSPRISSLTWSAPATTSSCWRPRASRSRVTSITCSGPIAC